MSASELHVDCPCCKARLVIDAASGTVLQSTAHKEAAPTLEDFMRGDKDRARDLEEKFAESRRLEENRLAALEKKFEWAKKNKDKLPDAPKPGIMWD